MQRQYRYTAVYNVQLYLQRTAMTDSVTLATIFCTFATHLAVKPSSVVCATNASFHSDVTLIMRRIPKQIHGLNCTCSNKFEITFLNELNVWNNHSHSGNKFEESVTHIQQVKSIFSLSHFTLQHKSIKYSTVSLSDMLLTALF